MTAIAVNRKATHDYEVLYNVQAGIVLRGDEIKSIRNKHISLVDAYAVVSRGEIVLINCYIAPYSHAYEKKDDNSGRRSRKLLLHKQEINRLIGDVSRKGYTLIPLRVYINDRGYAKIDLGIAKHKKTIDKKRELKERDIKRETDRAIKGVR